MNLLSQHRVEYQTLAREMKLFENFPKKRTELTQEYKNIYSEYYLKNREGNTFASFFSKQMEGWMHKKVASDVNNNHNKSTLEIGAGTLNQLKYEKTSPYDIIEPFHELFEKSPYKTCINNIYSDINELNDEKKYDRITSIATFEHILDLPDVLSKTCNLLKDDGLLRVAIPNEGSFCWKMGWKLTTGIEYKIKYKLDYGLLMKHEHVNTADEIDQLLNYFYNNVKCNYWGISKKLGFYRFYVCSSPNTENNIKYQTIVRSRKATYK